LESSCPKKKKEKKNTNFFLSLSFVATRVTVWVCAFFLLDDEGGEQSEKNRRRDKKKKKHFWSCVLCVGVRGAVACGLIGASGPQP
jgi:hypothetical protein